MTITLKARAKCEMRKECSGKDANEVIEIMKASMVDYYENELAIIESSLSQSFSGSKGKGSAIKQFVAILQNIAERERRNMFNFNELRKLITVSFDDFFFVFKRGYIIFLFDRTRI